jgi:hypothetical protein
MTKKRTSLDSFLTRAVDEIKSEEVIPPPAATQVQRGNRPDVKQQTAYLKTPVYEQLRRLAFEERGKMHDYIIEGSIPEKWRSFVGLDSIASGPFDPRHR